MTAEAVGATETAGVVRDAAPPLDTVETAIMARLPRHPVVAVLVLTLAFLATWFAWVALLGLDVPLWDAKRSFLNPYLWFGFLASFGSAYGLVGFFSARGVFTPPDDLVPLTRDGGMALRADWERSLRIAIPRSRYAGLAGLTIPIVSAAFVLGPRAAAAATPQDWKVLGFVAWYFVSWGVSFWLLFRGLALVGAWQKVYDRVMRDPRIDLLDMAPLEVCGRRAIEGAAYSVVAATGAALVIVHPTVGPHPFAIVGLLFAMWTGARSFVGFLAPARAAIVRAKQEELGRVRERIRAALAGPGGSGPPLQDLLAWEARIERIPDWPLNPLVTRRIATLAVTPLLGWFGSTLFNAGLDRLFK